MPFRGLLVLVLSMAPTVVFGQTTDLRCIEGSETAFVPQRVVHKIADISATVDLDKKTISTGLGDFPIHELTEKTAFFRGTETPTKGGITAVIAGELDRITGRMSWRLTLPERAREHLRRDGLWGWREWRCIATQKIF